VKDHIQGLVGALNGVLLGKEQQIKLALACLFARGHLLIEDLPGMGKTLLSHALARVLGLSYNRIQFTSDVLPADIIGTSIFDRNTGEFRFIEGPLFAQVVLADEINRATPKTQAALLEAMQEHQVTIGDQTFKLGHPFLVMATQNPLDLVGTFPLPDSQLDRFLLSFSLGYPDPAAERKLLTSEDRSLLLGRTTTLLSPEDVETLQQDCEKVHVSSNLLDYIQALLQETRDPRWFEAGLSPRAGLALLRASRAHAFLENREFVTPEDVKAVGADSLRHRLILSFEAEAEGLTSDDIITTLIKRVPVS